MLPLRIFTVFFSTLSTYEFTKYSAPQSLARGQPKPRHGLLDLVSILQICRKAIFLGVIIFIVSHVREIACFGVGISRPYPGHRDIAYASHHLSALVHRTVWGSYRFSCINYKNTNATLCGISSNSTACRATADYYYVVIELLSHDNPYRRVFLTMRIGNNLIVSMVTLKVRNYTTIMVRAMSEESEQGLNVCLAC